MNAHLFLASGATWREAFETAETTHSFAHWYVQTRDAVPVGPLRFDPQTGILEVDEFGSFLTVSKGVVSICPMMSAPFTLQKGHKVRAIHFLYPASLSTPAVFALLNQDVELVVWHWQVPITAASLEIGAESDVRPAAVRMRLQALECARGKRGFEIAREIVKEKLRRFGAGREWQTAVRKASSSRELMMTEAKGTQGFWQELGVQRSHSYLTSSIGAVTRQAAQARKSMTKRRAIDPTNAAINYANAVAASRILKQLVAVGLDSAVGFLHKRGSRPLVYDCLELLRAEIAERVTAYMRGGPHAQFRNMKEGIEIGAKARRDLNRLAAKCDAREPVRWMVKRIKHA